MQIAFYGVTRRVGTSANIAAVAAGLAHYCKASAVVGNAKEALESEAVVLTDCSSPNYTEESRAEVFRACDLLVLNVSLPCQELDEVYVRHSLVRKNVIFLVGKYYQDKSQELNNLARRFRISAERICALPYYPAFAQAYAKQEVFGFVKRLDGAGGCYGDLEFKKQLKRTLHAVMTYGKRKGDLFYG